MKEHEKEGGENHDARPADVRGELGTRFVSWAPGQRVHLERDFAGLGSLAAMAVVAVVGFFCASISCGFWGFVAIAFLIDLFWKVEKEFVPVFMFSWIFAIGALGAVAACWLTLRGYGHREVILDWREGHFVYRRGRKVREYRLADIAAVKLNGFSWISGPRDESESPPSACFRTWLDLTLPDGELTILESDVFSNDPEAAYQQLLPVVLELSQSLKVPWEWKAFEVELLQVKEQEDQLEIRNNPGWGPFWLGFFMLLFVAFMILVIGLNVVAACKEGQILGPIILGLLGVLGGGPPLALALYCMSAQRLVFSALGLRYVREIFGCPLWQRRFSLDQIGSATCVIRHGFFTLKIDTGRRPIYFGGDLSLEELSKAGNQIEEFLLRSSRP